MSNLENLNLCLDKVTTATTKARVFAAALAAEASTDPAEPVKPGPADPDVSPSKPPDTGVVVIGGIETINGHSKKADEGGFATVPRFETILSEKAVSWKPSTAKPEDRPYQIGPRTIAALRLKLPIGVTTRSTYYNCDHSTPEAKLAAHHNLNSRLSAIPGQDTMDALDVLVTVKPRAPQRDWNISDDKWASTQYDYKRRGMFVCENGTGRLSTNWDPAQDVDYLCDWYGKKIDAELESMLLQGINITL